MICLDLDRNRVLKISNLFNCAMEDIRLMQHALEGYTGTPVYTAICGKSPVYTAICGKSPVKPLYFCDRARILAI